MERVGDGGDGLEKDEENKEMKKMKRNPCSLNPHAQLTIDDFKRKEMKELVLKLETLPCIASLHVLEDGMKKKWRREV